MRFPVLLAAGVVLIAGGAALSEYARRHPAEPKPKEKPAPAGKPAAAPPLSLDELTSHHNLVYEAPEADAVTAAGKHLEELAAAAKPLPNVSAAAALGGSLSARGLIPAGDGVALWVEEAAGASLSKSRRYSLVWLGAGAKVLASGRSNVGPLASDGKRLVWAEEGQLLSVGLDAPLVKGVTEFGKARVVALAVAGDDVVAMLAPAGFDPFSTDPAYALVRFGADRNVKVLAKDLVRPQELQVVGGRAFFIAGYPSSLQSVPLDGGEVRTASERAESPLSVMGTKLVFRRGGDAPGLYGVSAEGGEAEKLASGEIERLGAEGERFVFGLGNAVQLHQDGKDSPLFELQSAPVELTLAGGTVWLLTRDDGGQLVLLKKPLGK